MMAITDIQYQYVLGDRVLYLGENQHCRDMGVVEGFDLWEDASSGCASLVYYVKIHGGSWLIEPARLSRYRHSWHSSVAPKPNKRAKLLPQWFRNHVRSDIKFGQHENAYGSYNTTSSDAPTHATD